MVITVANPAPPPANRHDQTRDQQFETMLDSYQRVGDLHTMTLYGDFQSLMDVQHWGIMMELERRQPANKKPANSDRHGCSMFQYRTADGSALMGRNFDHKYSELLAVWCYPDSGFTSLAFIPLNQWGYNEEKPFNPANPQHKRTLLNGPTTCIEGLNAKGVCLSLASLDKQSVTPDPNKQPRFLIHLVREILDHAASLDEAIAIAQRYNIFDNGRDLITHHIFLADAHSGSAVLEWNNGQMEVLRSGADPQVVTNRPLFGKSDGHLRQDCRRYCSLAEDLDKAGPEFGWQQGMAALEDAAQHNENYFIEGERWKVSSQWSAIFDMTHGSAYVCVNRKYDTIYQLAVPQ